MYWSRSSPGFSSICCRRLCRRRETIPMDQLVALEGESNSTWQCQKRVWSFLNEQNGQAVT